MVEARSQANSPWLDAGTFETVVASTPLISIDLLVQNKEGNYLLGLRNNRPAQGYWFVPGGRVRKNELLDAAFLRLTREELGAESSRTQAHFKGVYEHFYSDSIFGKDVSTHYVVLAYQLALPLTLAALPDQQHGRYAWWPLRDAAEDMRVHAHTRAYFR